MKVVLPYDGYGMRMLGWSGEGLPKPFQLVGDLPLVMHVVSHYAAYGRADFVLRLGRAADQTQDTISLMVVNHPRARYWNVRYLDIGMSTPIGGRLWLTRHPVAGEETLFANYSGVLSDVSLDDMVERVKASPDAAAMMLAVHPNASFRVPGARENETIAGFHCLTELPIRKSDGCLILCQPSLDLLGSGRNLDIAFEALPAPRQLIAYRYDGFWLPADTFKKRTLLNAMYDSGNVP